MTRYASPYRARRSRSTARRTGVSSSTARIAGLAAAECMAASRTLRRRSRMLHRHRPTGARRAIALGDPRARRADRMGRRPGRCARPTTTTSTSAPRSSRRAWSTATPIRSSPATAPTRPRPVSRARRTPTAGSCAPSGPRARPMTRHSRRLVEARLRAALAAGTTTVECKSGYGLSLDEELRHLRILRRVAARVPIRVVPDLPRRPRGAAGGRIDGRVCRGAWRTR